VTRNKSESKSQLVDLDELTVMFQNVLIAEDEYVCSIRRTLRLGICELYVIWFFYSMKFIIMLT